MRVSRVARCLTERDLQGLGPLAALKSEGSIVFAGSIGLTVAGLVVGQLWFMSSALLTGLFLAKPPPSPSRPVLLASVSHKLPTTMTPQWEAATAKYRAMQLQDPIREGGY